MQCPSCHTSVEASQRFCPTCGTVLTPPDADAPPDAAAAILAPQDLLIGQTLGGKYKLIRLLGEGGMGAVYEGEQQLGTAKRKVAVKTLHTHLSRDPNIRARFEREVGTVAELEHPNTIQVYDFGSNTDGILYIVMEFLHGKSLANALEKEGAMPPDRVERIMQQICGSLEEAHGRGIVHRDLKPDNVVLVDRAGKKDFVKVLDFGIAKRSHEADPTERRLTQQGTVLGTPPYMSPEQFTGRPIDARSDIYSLGVMAYEMLTGKLPFVANTPWEWATQHMTQRPIPIESLAGGLAIPGGMRAAILRALSKSPDERFPTVKEFIEAFTAGPPETSPMARRQKTEMGAPLDIAAAFGEAGAARAANPVAMPAPQGPKAIGANVSFPRPAAIPQPPVRETPRGPGRGLLLGVAGLIAIASIAAIVFAVRGSSHGNGKEVLFDQGTSVTPRSSVAPSSLAVTAAATVPAAATVDDVPPLSGNVRAAPPRAAPPHAVPPMGAGPASTPASVPAPAPMPVPAPTPIPVPAPAPKPVATYDGPECVTARKLKALGHPREAENWSLACTAKGGVP